MPSPLRKERISLAALVGNALEVCEALVKQQDHELTVTLPEEPLYVDADKTRLAQALCNLLSNAVKYSDRGSPVWLTVRREGNEAVVSVKDAGIGIQAPCCPGCSICSRRLIGRWRSRRAAWASA